MPFLLKATASLEKRSPLFLAITALILVGILGVGDYATGNDYSFSLFYLLPILLTAWYAGRKTGLFISFISAVTWMLADILIEEDYTHPSIYFWNGLIRFGFFVTSTLLASELKRSQVAIQILARTDFLTGAFNSRYFHELLENEIDRCNRYEHPFTLAYIDIDNFKQVNDLYGHDEGDRLIRFIVGEIQNQIRKSDVFARLGGDEFAILFPETGMLSAQAALTKIQGVITNHLNDKYPFLTLSAGSVTFNVAPQSAAETIHVADAAMYSVKSSTKNNILYSEYNG